MDEKFSHVSIETPSYQILKQAKHGQIILGFGVFFLFILSLVVFICIGFTILDDPILTKAIRYFLIAGLLFFSFISIVSLCLLDALANIQHTLLTINKKLMQVQSDVSFTKTFANNMLLKKTN